MGKKFSVKDDWESLKSIIAQYTKDNAIPPEFDADLLDSNVKHIQFGKNTNGPKHWGPFNWIDNMEAFVKERVDAGDVLIPCDSLGKLTIGFYNKTKNERYFINLSDMKKRYPYLPLTRKARSALVGEIWGKTEE